MTTKQEIHESDWRELCRVARKNGCKVEIGEFFKVHEAHGNIFKLTGMISIYGWFDAYGNARFSVFVP